MTNMTIRHRLYTALHTCAAWGRHNMLRTEAAWNMAFFGRNYAFLGGVGGVGQGEGDLWECYIYPEGITRGFFLIMKNDHFMNISNRNIAEKPSIAPP